MTIPFIITFIVAMAAFWTYIDRRFPSTRLPFIYREKLWQNFLGNLIFMAAINFFIWSFMI